MVVDFNIPLTAMYQPSRHVYITCKPNDNYKGKTCSIYTKDYNKGVKAYHYKK